MEEGLGIARGVAAVPPASVAEPARPAALAAGGDPVTILMGLYDGAAHLDAQLDSFAAQTHGNWRLVVSDDGSRDAGPDLVRAFGERAPRGPGQVALVRGPGAGLARNYLAMIAGLEAEPGWLAFSDQDDIWLPERLARGVAALDAVAGPALYCSRTLIFPGDTAKTRLSRPRPRPPGFGNALVQNICAGNTILVNPAGAALLRAAALRTAEVVVHDWWAYQLIAGARGGVVVHDDRPSVLYRQHGRNAIGANDSLRSRLYRLWQLLNGTMRGWTETNLAALDAADPWLSAEARAQIAALRAMREERRVMARMAAFRRLGLYRQTASSTWALWFAAATRLL